jgi:hypothetical protein
LRAQRLCGRAESLVLLAIGLAGGVLGASTSTAWIVWLAFAVAAGGGIVIGVRAAFLRRRTFLMPFNEESSFVLDSVNRDSGWLSTAEDIAVFEKFAAEHMPDAHGYPTSDAISARLVRNDTLVFGTFRNKDKTRDVTACFVVYPLTETALKKFQQGKWDNARGLEPSHICRNWVSAAGLYVALILGTSPSSKSDIERALLQFVRLNRRIPLLGRRATEDGERIMRKFKMAPIVSTAPDGVWMRSPTKADRSSAS